jgi:hypothetical protein
MDWGEQQPIARTVGRRMPSPPGVPPSGAARDASRLMAQFPLRVPKGVLRYRSHDEMTRDRERWTAEAMAAIARSRA